MFHTFSMIGLGVGFIIDTFLIAKKYDNDIFNIHTIGSFFTGVAFFILFILTFILFTEAYSKYFNMTTLQSLGQEVYDNNEENENDISNGNIGVGENIEKEVKRQSILIKNKKRIQKRNRTKFKKIS